MVATRISTVYKVGLTLGLALSMSTLETSSSFSYSAKARQMCMGDAFRLCSSEIPNISRIVACMRRNKANLSPGCRSVMDQEDTAATKTKPVQAAPVEQKLTTTSPVKQSANPVQAAPVEHKQTLAPPVEPKPAQVMPVEQKEPTASRVEQPAATETKPVLSEPVEHRPTTAPPVEQPAAPEGKPVQAAPVEQKPTTATAVEVKRVEARPASRGAPAKITHRRHKHRQPTAGWHFYREFRDVERTIGFALPIPLVIRFYW
jgi:hypothetical protein